jgi:hypothetical protein
MDLLVLFHVMNEGTINILGTSIASREPLRLTMQNTTLNSQSQMRRAHLPYTAPLCVKQKQSSHT